MSQVRLKPGTSIEKALYRLKRKVEREDTLAEVRSRRAFSKPSEKKRLRMKKSKFEQKLRAERERY